jgi:tRNA threonylcarbamoyl adenosine modification protein YeaZ
MREGLVLALDTATRWPVVALAGRDGKPAGERRWESRHRHSEQLIEQLDELLGSTGRRPIDIESLVVGIGPGSFTGLRIGLATAKTLAYSLAVPLVGIPTSHALALAATAATTTTTTAGGQGGPVEVAVSLPAGVADRYVAHLRVEAGSVREPAAPRLVATPEEFAEITHGDLLVAVDLAAPDVPAEAQERGHRAVEGLAGALLALGIRALDAGRTDDVAALVPAYVALPRGMAQSAEEMVWSPDLP